MFLRQGNERQRVCHDRNADIFKIAVETNQLIIDKSLLIQEMIDDHTRGKMLTFPSGYGKTFNLSMLKYFFEISEHDQSYLFKNFAIRKSPARYWEHQGKHPVIFISLQDMINHDYKNKYKELIADLYQKYLPILTKKRVLSEYDNVRYQKIINRTAIYIEVKYALTELIKLLSLAYSKSVMLLLDICKIGFYGEQYREKIDDYICEVLGPLKDDAHLGHAIVTGLLPLRSENRRFIFTNLTVLFPHRYTAFYGFSADEVKKLFKVCCVSNMLESFIDWQSAYRCASKNRMVNSRVTIEYLRAREQVTEKLLVTTYLPTVLNQMIVDYVVDFASLSDASLILDIIINNMNIIKNNLTSLLENKSIIREINEYGNNGVDIWYLLVLTGYLTSKTIRSENSKNNYKDYILISISNKTVFQFFKTTMNHFKKTNNLKIQKR